MEIRFVRSEEGDWVDTYIDGEIVLSGHSVDEYDLLEAVALRGAAVTSVRTIEVEPEDGYMGPLPPDNDPRWRTRYP